MRRLIYIFICILFTGCNNEDEKDFFIHSVASGFVIPEPDWSLEEKVYAYVLYYDMINLWLNEKFKGEVLLQIVLDNHTASHDAHDVYISGNVVYSKSIKKVYGDDYWDYMDNAIYSSKFENKGYNRDTGCFIEGGIYLTIDEEGYKDSKQIAEAVKRSFNYFKIKMENYSSNIEQEIPE